MSAAALDSVARGDAPFAFEPFGLPASNQRALGAPHSPGTVLPLALRPAGTDGADLGAAIAEVRRLQATGELTTALAKNGALLFRGLPIRTAKDFSEFAHAFGFAPHEIIGIVVERPELAPNVAPANESSKEVLIYNHNESPQVPHAPEYVMFNAHHIAAGLEGGETPISSSLELFELARREIPEFVAELAEKGILSRITYTAEPQYKGGSTLRQAFGKHVLESDPPQVRRAKMEVQLARYARGKHTTWEWQDGGDTLIVTHRLPAIRTQPGTGLGTLFTGLAAYWKNAQQQAQQGAASATQAARKKVTVQTFGDGTPIPDRYLAKLAEITDRIRILHKWQVGDVLVFDNVIAQHGREPWKGEQSDRVVLASLWDGQVPGAYTDADWARVVQALEDVGFEGKPAKL